MEEDRDQEGFLKYGNVFTPSREEQLETIVSLIPAARSEEFTVVDLGCGGGFLIEKILEVFPNVRAIGIDKAGYMLDSARQRTERFGDRVILRDFDITDKRWQSEIPEKVRCFVSSLAIHHLNEEEKQQLFRELYERLEEKGAVFIIDLVEPVNKRVKEYFGNLWDKAVKEQTKGQLDAYQFFKEEEWNYYQWKEQDEEDMPSRLFEQLKWLEQAGFSEVDCFWLRAGHAIFGGYK